MKIAIAQTNTTVGDLQNNYDKISRFIQEANEKNAELVIFPELTITGYPPKDLLAKKSFVKRNLELLRKIADEHINISAIIGFVDEYENKLYNAAAFIENGKIIKIYHKIHLPNYDVFDEKRYFSSGDRADLINFKGLSIGLNICEDIWIEDGPADEQCRMGADLIINISSSPFYLEKRKIREKLLSEKAKRYSTPIIYVNTVGAQDELIFDGRSYFFNGSGEINSTAKSFTEDLLLIEFEKGLNHGLVNLNNNDNNNDSINSIDNKERKENWKNNENNKENPNEELFQALILGIRDYFHKNGFNKAVIGLSGGIDSALTAVLAVEALGKENVLGITMPSKFSSVGSVEDSRLLADNLGIRIETIPIKEAYESYLSGLNHLFKDTEFNVAEENIQARIRGNILMAVSNKFGYLVLTTGNKSELSVGYATLYGDMAGGLAVISDVFKTKVYELSRYINQIFGKEVIPETIIVKEPSAELRDNQKDSDSLPEYEILDQILRLYIEEDKSYHEINIAGFNPETVSKVIRMVDRNEYKRQQAALGLKITPRAFGSGRRMPITNRWRE